MNKEQPESEVSGTVSAESFGFDATDITLGSLNKFKDVKSLEEAYVNLQSEFTRKCQKLSVLEKENSKIVEENNSLKSKQNNLEPYYEKPEWNEIVKNFLKENSSAQNYASDIMKVLIEDKVLASMPNSLELAFNKVKASKYKSEKELITDRNFINEYVLNNEEIKKEIISNYLNSIKKNKSPQLINTSKTGSVGVTPQKKPTTLTEANELARKLFN